MSSAEDEVHDHETHLTHGSKKRRVQRACDVCRRKKIRCDGGQMPGNRCSNCTAYSFDCTYVEAAKKRGPPKGYVESLENRLEKMENLLSKLCPDADLSKELGDQLGETWFRERGETPQSSTGKGAKSPAVPAISSSTRRSRAPSSVGPDELDPSDDEYLRTTLTENLKALAVDPNHHRFFGKSSGVMFIQTAIDLKNEYAGDDGPFVNESPPVAKRPEFWESNAWETHRLEEFDSGYDFPPDDLMESLVDTFFLNMNSFYPLLHEPTFRQNIADSLHRRDSGFGAVLLGVCANGSRWSDDPRVFIEGPQSSHSAGWKWFNQIQVGRKSMLAPPCLYDVQSYCLCVIFLQGSSAPQGSWTMVGVGLRLAQDVGAHRRKVYNSTLTIEDELWKRAFWILVTLDRLFSCALGRPCAIQDEDFDLDMPVDCDDEYWLHPDPEKAFKQPPDKPSKVAYFNCFLKLNEILAFALRTIYSINKSKLLLGFVGPQWEQHIVAELDSALNKFIDTIPDHLRWDPHREDELFFQQSAMLYCSYYHIQILVHRPFIPLPRKPSPLSFPSLAICTNAARSLSHVVDILRKRSKQPLPQLLMAVFSAGIVLLLNIWGGKRSGLSTDPAKEMAEVYKCMQVLKACEPRWQTAGRLWDILYELASVGNLPLPHSSPAPSGKRGRDSDEPISGTTTHQPTVVTADGTRSIAGSRRVSRDYYPSSRSSSIHPSLLPIHSDELGRLPLHPSFGMSSHSTSPIDRSTPIGGWYGNNDMGLSTETSTTMGSMDGIDSMSSMYQVDPVISDQILSDFSRSIAQSNPQDAVPQHYQHTLLQDLAESEMNAAGPSSAQPQMFMNDMWSNAPTGFELDDWGTYINSMCLTNQSQYPDNPNGPRTNL